MSRVYDIILSCGCMISLDGGGGLIPCDGTACKYDEEYRDTPQYEEDEAEIRRRNGDV